MTSFADQSRQFWKDIKKDRSGFALVLYTLLIASISIALTSSVFVIFNPAPTKEWEVETEKRLIIPSNCHVCEEKYKENWVWHAKYKNGSAGSIEGWWDGNNSNRMWRNNIHQPSTKYERERLEQCYDAWTQREFHGSPKFLEE